MKKVCFIASECVPFVKTGGLADVVGSLPKYFDKENFDVRVIIPDYTCIPETYRSQMQYRTHFYMNYNGRDRYAREILNYVLEKEEIRRKDREEGQWHV